MDFLASTRPSCRYCLNFYDQYSLYHWLSCNSYWALQIIQSANHLHQPNQMLHQFSPFRDLCSSLLKIFETMFYLSCLASPYRIDRRLILGSIYLSSLLWQFSQSKFLFWPKWSVIMLWMIMCYPDFWQTLALFDLLYSKLYYFSSLFFISHLSKLFRSYRSRSLRKCSLKIISKFNHQLFSKTGKTFIYLVRLFHLYIQDLLKFCKDQYY